MTAPDPERLADLVEQFLDRRGRGEAVSPEQFAAGHAEAGPDLLAAVRASLEVMATLTDGEEPPPERIGGWRVVREIGRGGMGIVYEVERDGRRCALKRMALAALLQPRALQRFHREAQVLQRLRHPGIVGVHEAGTADGVPFLVMDLIEGQPLVTTSPPMPWRRAVVMIRDVARAVGAAHTAGLVHRDLKPQNVLVRPDGTPVVVDFGLVHDATDATLTGTGDLLGTPRYLAPEQVDGGHADARTDVYALGLILVELLAGAPARRGHDRSSLLREAAHGLATDAVPRVPGAPRNLVRLLRAATARRPQHRPADGNALAADLDAVLDGTSIAARPPGPWWRVVDLFRDRPRLAGAALTTLMVAGIAAAWTWQVARDANAERRLRAASLDAVAAWYAGDASSAVAASELALAAAPRHAVALAVACLVTPDAVDDRRAPDPWRDALVARADQDWAAAARALRQLAIATPDCPLARLLLAEAEEKLGRMAEADAELAFAASLLPGSVAVASALGSLRDRRGDPRGAASEHRRAMALAPDSFPVRLRLARSLERFDAEAALAEVEAATPLVPAGDQTAGSALANLHGALLDRLGRPSEALPIFEALAAQHPQDARYAFNVAYALDRLLRVREAKPWYERTLQLDQNNVSAMLCLAWLHATATEPELQDVARGERLLLQALARDTGKTAAVLQMVREFGLRTGRIEALVAALQDLAKRDSLPAPQRATLEHTANYLRNGAPPSGR